MKFWTGAHHPEWLGRTNAPLFVSAIQLRKRVALPRAVGAWALDSGGFTEIATHGFWRTSPLQYSSEVRHWMNAVGNLAWAAPQDWMCEPDMIHGNAEKGIPGTRFSVREHQRLTVENYLLLRQLAPDLPWVPVLQGWELEDYHRCADLYASHGVDLYAAPLVGVGSVCKRQGTKEAARIIRSLYARGFSNLHGFGLKILGLVGRARLARFLASSDSMSWSWDGRQNWRHRRRRMCPVDHQSGCANCLHWLIAWRRRLVERIESVTAPRPMTMFG